MNNWTKLPVIMLALLTIAACGGLSDAGKHYNAGVELGEQGRFEEAIAEYDEAIRLDPEDAEAYNNSGSTSGPLPAMTKLSALIPNMPTPTTTGEAPTATWGNSIAL